MTIINKPYRPSNGTEGDAFESRWCARCVRDDYEAGDYCEILGNALAGMQPPEWVYRAGIPTCTAFTDTPLPEPRCEFTKEMEF